MLRANLAVPDPRIPLQVRLFLDSGMRRLVDDEVREWAPDVCHATMARMAPYLPPPGTCHRHLDLMDSLYLNMRSRSTTGNLATRPLFALEARLLKPYESRMASQADSCSVVANADLQAVGAAHATVLPNGVDSDAFAFADPGIRPPVIIFFGNLGYFHNFPPARFLVHEVLPRVRERVPDASLRLVGARPSGAMRRLGHEVGVELVDTPSSMVAEIHAAAVAAIPMFSGSGMKNKVLEAFSAGTPVVSNALGMDGVDGANAGEHYAGGESAEALASQTVRLLKDSAERRRMAAAARGLVVAQYSWDRRAEVLLKLYTGERITGS
jgi:glycosyltransferase involved in cell wall biosynthesis